MNNCQQQRFLICDLRSYAGGVKDHQPVSGCAFPAPRRRNSGRGGPWGIEIPAGLAVHTGAADRADINRRVLLAPKSRRIRRSRSRSVDGHRRSCGPDEILRVILICLSKPRSRPFLPSVDGLQPHGSLDRELLRTKSSPRSKPSQGVPH